MVLRMISWPLVTSSLTEPEDSTALVALLDILLTLSCMLTIVLLTLEASFSCSLASRLTAIIFSLRSAEAIFNGPATLITSEIDERSNSINWLKFADTWPNSSAPLTVNFWLKLPSPLDKLSKDSAISTADFTMFLVTIVAISIMMANKITPIMMVV